LVESVPKARFDVVEADLEAKVTELENKLALSVPKSEAEVLQAKLKP